MTDKEPPDALSTINIPFNTQLRAILPSIYTSSVLPFNTVVIHTQRCRSTFSISHFSKLVSIYSPPGAPPLTGRMLFSLRVSNLNSEPETPPLPSPAVLTRIPSLLAFCPRYITIVAKLGPPLTIKKGLFLPLFTVQSAMYIHVVSENSPP